MELSFFICIFENPGSEASSHSWCLKHARDGARLSNIIISKTVSFFFFQPIYSLMRDDYFFLTPPEFLTLFCLSADDLASYFTEKNGISQKKALTCLLHTYSATRIHARIYSVSPPIQGTSMLLPEPRSSTRFLLLQLLLIPAMQPRLSSIISLSLVDHPLA